MKAKRKARYMTLRSAWFTPLESRELSAIPRRTPALKLAVQERLDRRNRFEKVAAAKIASGRWRRGQIAGKWQNNLSRMYYKRGWRVQSGPVGRQQKMTKGNPNPWALYRDAERRTGGPGEQGYVHARQVSRGKTPQLEKGLVLVQQAERKAKSPGGVSQMQVRQWIEEKDGAIGRSSGKRKEKLIIERNRLERLLK